MPVKVEALSIVKYPAPVLRRKAAAVAQITDEVRAVAGRMLELMHEHEGVGLAAPQVGLGWRMFVANDPQDESTGDLVFINPVLRDPADTLEPREEGCLSIPGVHVQVRRPIAITIDAIGLDGEPFSLTRDTLGARIWQHETDHLDGVLILDRMSPLDKIANRRAIKELEDACGV